MKRAFGNSHGQYKNSVDDDEAKARLKHQNLLQEFLELQKEFVAKKKKLETIKHMRGTLSNEVRFLRQRYKYLSKIKSQEYELRQDSVRSQEHGINESVSRRPDSVRSQDHGINESVSRRPDSVRSQDHGINEGDVRSRVDVRVVSSEEKKPQNNLINGKKVGKKKISWRDPVALEAL